TRRAGAPHLCRVPPRIGHSVGSNPAAGAETVSAHRLRTPAVECVCAAGASREGTPIRLGPLERAVAIERMVGKKGSGVFFGAACEKKTPDPFSYCGRWKRPM